LPGTFDNSQLGGFYTDKDYFNTADAVDLVASEGSLIFFNQHIVHGSTPNNSNQERRAYIVTYQPKDRAMLKSRKVKNIKIV
jgi:ectoine hydroxylase-related dioxygenase (phytanoyl-CoA dioxygenase family)